LKEKNTMGDLSLEDQNFVQRQTELIAATDDDSDDDSGDFVGDIILQVRPAIRDQDYFPPDHAVTAIQGTGVVQNGVGVGVEGIGGQVGSAGTGIGVRGIGVNDGIGVHGLGGEDALGVGVIGQGGYGGDNQAAVFGGVGVMGLSGGAEVPAPDINNLTTKNVGVFGRGYGNSSVGVRGEARYVLPDGNTDSDGMHAKEGDGAFRPSERSLESTPCQEKEVAAASLVRASPIYDLNLRNKIIFPGQV
jgi:hypothetical protein